MMKVLFWILLLVNAAMFAYGEWGASLFVQPQTVGAQPPLHEDKVTLIKGAELVAPASSTPSILPASSTDISSTASRVQNAVPASSVCMEWSDFSGTDLKRVNQALAGLSLGKKLSQRQVEYDIGYWVYIPPLKDKSAIKMKIDQLKERGISEYFVVQDQGEWHHAISLGVFKSQDVAQKFLDSLVTKGILSAQIGQRASKLKVTVFEFNKLDTATVTKLNALQSDYPNTELNVQTCQ